jgi:DNA-binding CsgD family transcriptional regulator
MCTFQDMTQAITCKYNDLIKKSCRPAMECFNLSHIGYYKVTNSGRYTYFGTHAGWSEYFAEKKLYLNFPYYRHPKYFQEDVSVVGATADRPLLEILREARTNFQIHQGLLILNRVSEGFEGFGFFSKSSRGDQNAMLLQELPLLKLFIRKLKEENPLLFSLADEQEIDLAKLVGSTFYDKNPDLIYPQPARQKFLKEMDIHLESLPSEREVEVVKLLVNGHSAAQIGKRLHLSKRTIEHHIERIKGKFSCHSKAELIEKARELESYGILR